MKPLDYLSSIHTEKTTLSFRYIRLSIQKNSYSAFSEIIILFIEHAQLLSQSILATFPLYSDPDLNNDSIQLKNLISPLSKAFDLSHLIEPGDYNVSAMAAACVIMASFSLTIIAMILYIFKLAFRKQQGQKSLVEMWRVLFSTLGKVTSFYMGSFYAGIFHLNEDKILSLPIWASSVITAVFWSSIVFLYIVGILLEKYCIYVLPSKSLLASKSTTLGAWTMVQKMIMLLLIEFLEGDPSVNRWVYPLVGLLFDFLRLEHFFRVLPLYKSRALFMQVSWLAVLSSLNLASFMQAILQGLDYSPSVNLLLVNWIILSVVTIKGSRNYLRQMLLKEMTKTQRTNPDIMSHKVFLMKELKKIDERINEKKAKYYWEQLIRASVNINPKSMENMNSHSNRILFASKKSANELYLRYLNSLQLQFPKNDMIKLYITYFYAKKLKKYAIALRLLGELQSSQFHIIRCNAALLVEEVQDALRKGYNTSDSKLDMFNYSKNIFLIVELKKNMLKQCELQINLCQEMNQRAPNLAKIFDLSQSIYSSRTRTLKNMKIMKEAIPEYYLEPLALCAYYHLISNHMIPEYYEYMKIFWQRYQKHENILKGPEFCKENLYGKDACALLVSGLKDSQGTITFASKQSKQIFGKDLTNEPLYKIVSPFQQRFWSDARFTFSGYQDHLTPNPIQRVFIYNSRSGFVIPGGFFINVHPYIWKGLHYVFVFRPMPNPKEYIILSGNGVIQTFTEKIAKKLRLSSPTEPNPSTGLSISQFSPELDEISRAYDLMNSKTEREPITEEINNARELLNQYSTNGGVIKMKALKQNSAEGKHEHREVYEFHCKFQGRLSGGNVTKIITLDELEPKKANSKEISIVESEKISEISEEVLEKKDYEELHGLTDDEIPFEDKPSFKTNLDFTFTNRESRDITPLQLDSQNNVSARPQVPLQFPNQTLDTTEPMMTTARQLLVNNNKSSTEQNEGNRTPRKSVFSPARQAKPTDSTLPKEKVKQITDIETQSFNSQKSNSSGQIRKMKVFHEVLSLNRSSKNYKIFLLMVLGLVIGMMINEFMLKFSLDNYISNLQSSKDVFSMARMRNIRLMDIHRNTRYIWLIETGRLNEQEVVIGLRKVGSADRLTKFSNELAVAQRNLQDAVSSLDAKLSQTVFEDNVNMYDGSENQTEQKYITLNTFDATSEIIAATLQNIQMAYNNASDTDILPTLNFVLRNVINDILIRTEEVVDIFLSRLDTDHQKSLNDGIIATGILTLVIIVFMTAWMHLIYQFYSKDKKYLTAFTQVNLSEVSTVQERIVKFTKMIEEEINFEDAPPVSISQFLYRRESRDKLAAKSRTESNYRGIRKNYMIKTVRLAIIVLCLFGIVGANIGLSYSLINSLEVKVHHLQVTSALAGQITLSAAILIDIVAENNTSLVMNETPSAIAGETITEISVLRNQVLDIFQTSSASQRKILKPLLFADQCENLPNLVVRPYCELMTRGQNATGFIQLTTSFEFFFTDFVTGFMASNRSEETLHDDQLKAHNLQVPAAIALQDLAFLIWRAIDKDLEESISGGFTNNVVKLGGLGGALVVIYLLFWYVILVKLRESDNRLRRVLQTLPANLILSNFILKSYLLKISEGRLDFIRNGI